MEGAELNKLSLQQNLEKLIEWSEAEQIPFNVAKFTGMHNGCLNASFNYKILDANLAAVNQQRYQSVLILNNLKRDAQVEKIYTKAIRNL